MRAATPIAFAALCGVMCERSGVVNIGIEGTMLAAAFVGWYAGVLAVDSLGDPKLALFGVTPALIVGVLAAVAVGMIDLGAARVALDQGEADQIISGTIINILAFGLTGYLYTIVTELTQRRGRRSPASACPRSSPSCRSSAGSSSMLLDQGPITMSLVVIVVVFQVLLFRSRWGLRTRAVGEHPRRPRRWASTSSACATAT